MRSSITLRKMEGLSELKDPLQLSVIFWVNATFLT